MGETHEVSRFGHVELADMPDDLRERIGSIAEKSGFVPNVFRALGRRQIGYTVQGAEVTIIDRRAPAHPRLDAGWTSTPLALLRLDPDGSGRWTLYRPAADGGWTRTSEGDDPIALLAAQAPA